MAKKTYDELYLEMQKLKKKMKDAKEEEKKNSRAWRNHALTVIGGEVLTCFDNSDWTKIDIEKFSNYIKQYKPVIQKRCQIIEDQSPTEANKKIRAFEKRKRELKKQNQTVSTTNIADEIEIDDEEFRYYE